MHYTHRHSQLKIWILLHLKWNRNNELGGKGLERRHHFWCFWENWKTTPVCASSPTLFSSHTSDDDAGGSFGWGHVFPAAASAVGHLTKTQLVGIKHWVFLKQQVLSGKLEAARSGQKVPHKPSPQGMSLARCTTRGGNTALFPQWYATCQEHAGHWGSYRCLGFTWCIYRVHGTWTQRGITSYQTLNTKTASSYQGSAQASTSLFS